MAKRSIDLTVPFDASGSVVGIDPGMSGGIALLNPSAEVKAWSFAGKTREQVVEIFRFISSLRPVLAYVEKVSSRPGQASQSVFTFGMAFERVCMGVACFGIPYTMVRPQEWQRGTGCPMAPKDKSLKPHRRRTIHKNALKKKAMDHFPGAKVTLGTCDAILIAMFGMSKQLGVVK